MYRPNSLYALIRRALLLLALCFACATAQAQNWEVAIGGFNKETAFCVENAPTFGDFALVIGGTHTYGGFNSPNPPNVFVSLSDIAGSFVAGVVYDFQSWDIDYSIIDVGGGDFIFTTGVWNPRACSFDIAVVRADFTGAIIWSTFLGGPATDGGTSLIQEAGGDIVVAGYVESPSNGCRDGFLGLLDDVTGAVIWAHAYGGPFNDELWSVRESMAGFIPGSVYAVGYSNNNTGGADDDLWMLNVDIATGLAVPVSNTYGAPGANDRGYALLLQLDPFMGPVINLVGESYGFGAFNNDVYVVRTDPAGAFFWQQLYETGTAADPGWDIGWDVEESIRYGPGDIVVVGQANNGIDPRGRAIALEIDGFGVPLPGSQAYGGPDFEGARSIDLNPILGDPHYYIAGMTYSVNIGGGDQYLLRADAMLQTGFDAAGQTCAQRISPTFLDATGILPFTVGIVPVPLTPPVFPQTTLTGESIRVCVDATPLIDPPEEVDKNEKQDRIRKQALPNDNRLKLSLAPNPLRSGNPLLLNFVAQSEASVQIKVSDALGRTMFEGEVSGSDKPQEMQVVTQGWPAGAYTVTLRSGEELQAANVVVNQ